VADVLFKCVQNWKSYTLEPNKDSGVIISVCSGGTPNTSKSENWGGEILWLTPKELSDFPIHGIPNIEYTKRKLTNEGLRNCGASLLPTNAVILSKRAPVGLVTVNTGELSTNQGFLNLECGDKINPRYLAYWLKANTHYLEMVANGTTYSELYASDLFEFTIYLPEIDYQEKVVDYMDNLFKMVNLVAANGVQSQSDRFLKMADNVLISLLSGTFLI
jgi:type I restriction enzyme S subunit